MRYKMRRRLYSQNFLRSPKLTLKLIRLSTIGKKDTVIEIGPGKGFITAKLLGQSGRVIGIELDRKLCLHLNSRFPSRKNLKIVNQNFLNYPLPDYPFKVFSNIPFRITSDILRKLTTDKNFEEGYLVVQKEAAKRFIGKPYDNKNSMVATLLAPWFEISVFWQFQRGDFIPKPNVDVVMLRIKRRENALISDLVGETYKNFVVYSYNYHKIAGMDFRSLLIRFDRFIKSSNKRERNFVSEKAKKILHEQNKLVKIHRSRTDRSWKKFK